MNLLLITYDYPYGIGEPFLETEISVLQEHFERIVIMSLSQSREITRCVPANVEIVKCDRSFATIRSGLYACMKLLSPEFFREMKDAKRMQNTPGLFSLVKSCVKAWAIEKRLFLKVQKMGLDKKQTVAYSYWLAESAYFITKHKNMWMKTISRVHGYEVRDYEQYIPFRRLVDSEMDEIHFISNFTEDAYERIMKPIRTGKMGAKHYISRLGVDCPKNCEKRTEKDHRQITIASCSSIYKLKRLDLIVSMLEAYDGTIPVKWVHFGWGELGEEIAKLCEQKLSKKANVSYELKGWVEHTQVLEYYKCHNISLFINASDAEGVPVSIMEAMSYGIPCMARNVGGMSEIIIDNLNGYLLPETPQIEGMVSVLEHVIHEKGVPCSEDIWTWCQKHYDAKKNYQLFCATIV